jgi:asparagine synthase (glutamine-hydrolysing)
VDLKTYLPEDILTKVDRASMAQGLEVRVPFLDHRVVEFAAALPVHLRVRAGKQKYILKRAFEGILPRSVLDRPKQGFIVPEAPWLQKRALGLKLEHLSAPGSHVSRFILPDKIPFLLRKFQEFNPYPGRLLWALVILEAWFERMEREGGITVPDTTGGLGA